MRGRLTLLAALAACAAFAEVLVSSPDEIYAAVDRALKDPTASREIVLRPGGVRHADASVGHARL